jgi:hypothetical protein
MFLSHIIWSSKVMHSGPCLKKSPTSHYDHPWCGTPMLMMYHVGQSFVFMVET